MPDTPTPSSFKQIARGVARPVLSPIDGRVADINRRIADTRSRVEDGSRRFAVLEAAIASFAESSTEASSYVGIELARMAGLIDSLERATQESTRSAQETYHARRLADAAGLPLEQLDGELAAVLNHAAGHLGFAAQAELWFNPPVTVELRQGAAELSSVNERIVEVPFAMMALGRLPPGSPILDIGSAESTFPLSAASLGHAVTAVDPRGLPYEHPNLVTFAGRFEDLPAPEERFAAAFLISTIEHVGLPAYGVTPRGTVVPGDGADRELLQRVRELLVDDGIVVLTTPYGARSVSQFERTYDDDALDQLLEGWNLLERRTVSRRGLTWGPLDSIGQVDELGVVLVVATPVRP